MNILHNIINKLNPKELLELKSDIESGEVQRMITNKLEKFKNINKVCPVCNTSIKEGGLTLIFGPPGFRRKAVFDGTDCLEYFVSKIKK